mmetsp:Transcript_93222/g.182715  ORF Transcript_93222/g.182715 Transcript_93222/m.182715 type:complete len:165 (+) Transcript_93222:64-558(+)
MILRVAKKHLFRVVIDLDSISGLPSRLFSVATSPGSQVLVAKKEGLVEEGQAIDMVVFDEWAVQDKVPRSQQRSGTATHEALLDSHTQKEKSDAVEGLGSPGELEHCRNEGVEGHRDSEADRNMPNSVGIQGEAQGIPVVGVDTDLPFAVCGQGVVNEGCDYLE